MAAAIETAAFGEEPCPEEVSAAYFERARLMKARRGQIIIAEGGASTDVYLVRSGKLQISLFSRQGREVILREVGPGHIIGELAAIDQQPRSSNAMALTDAVLGQMDREAFLDFLGVVPKAGLWMSRLLAARVRSLTERAFELATLPVAGRVHRELLRLVVETGVADDRVLLEGIPTHADIASRIGTHREAVTRELNCLAAEGIVRQTRRQIEILSVAKLRSCYDRLQR